MFSFCWLSTRAKAASAFAPVSRVSYSHSPPSSTAFSRLRSSRLMFRVSFAWQGFPACRPVQKLMQAWLSPSQVLRRVFSSRAVWRGVSSSSSTSVSRSRYCTSSVVSPPRS